MPQQSALSVLAHNYSQKKYKTGDAILVPGQKPDGGLFIESGRVVQYAITNEGNQLVLNIYKQQSVLPMNWLINDTEVKYFFEADSDVVIRIVPKQTLRLFFEQNTGGETFQLLSRFLRGTDGLLTRFLASASGTARDKVCNELMIEAIRFHAGNQIINLQLTEEDLAKRTGLARETVSRELKKLVADGILSKFRGGVTVIDINRLLE